MHTLFIWKSTRDGRSEACHYVRNLADLKDLIETELRGRPFHLQARPTDDPDEIVDDRLRSSADDMTDDDFHWLTATVAGELRGIRV